MLTTGVGSGITYWIQFDQAQRELEERERVRAELIFSEIGSLLDERLWATRRVLWAKCNNQISDELIVKRESDYDKVLVKWNINLNKNEQLLSRYFGKETKSHFDTLLLPTYIDLGKLVLRKKETFNSNCDQIENRIESLNRAISKFDRILLDAIKVGNIGTLKKSRLDFNADSITYRYTEHVLDTLIDI